jgi:alpha-glucosidase (family GH31 glycosyl hydrolase)
MPYVSHDTGGFDGNPIYGSPTPELYTRWMEEAVFILVMRVHGNLNCDRWP